MTTTTSILTAPLGFFEKLRVIAACAVAWLLLGTLGWQMAHPLDPQMGVTLTRSERSIMAAGPALLVLTVFAAAIGTVIIGRRLPEAGALAASVGLAGMSIRGGTMQSLLAYYADSATEPRRQLMWAMLADALIWTAILAAAWLSMLTVRRWLWPELVATIVPETPPASTKSAKGAAPATDKNKAGWPALVITTIIAMIVIWLTIARSPVANIARGQVLASVGGGLFLGAMAARYFMGITNSTWYVLAVPVVTFAGYILGHFSSDMSWAQGTPWQPYAYLAVTPPHQLVRPLPIEYLSAGIAGALIGYWMGHRMEHVVENELT